MSSIKESSLGLNYGWTYGETGWNSGMDENIVLTGFHANKQIKGILSTPPTTRVNNGDAYIVGNSPTGTWVGNYAKVAIYDRGSWLFATPSTGVSVYNKGDGCWYEYNNGWSLKPEAEESPYIKVKDFDFSTGYTITDSRQLLFYPTNQTYYQWSGTFPKVVSAGSTPATSGGISSTAWIDRTDLTLRSDINLVTKVFNCVAEMIADDTLIEGQQVEWKAYYSGGSTGGNVGVVVAAGTGTEDGGSFFDTVGGLQIKATLNESNIDVYKFGAYSDKIHDDITSINNAIIFAYNNGFNSVGLGLKHLISNTIQMKGIVRLVGSGPRLSEITPSSDFKVISCTSAAQLYDFSVNILAIPNFASTVIEYAMPTDYVLQGAKYTSNVWIWSATHTGVALALVATNKYIAFSTFDLNVIGYIGTGIYFDSGTSYIQGNIFTGNITANSAYKAASDATQWAGNVFKCVVQTASNSGSTKNHQVKGTNISEFWDVGVNNSLVEFKPDSLLISSLFNPKASAQQVVGGKSQSALSRNAFILDGYCRSWDNSSMAQWYVNTAPAAYNSLQKGFVEFVENCNGATLSNKFTLYNMTQAPIAAGQSGGVLKSGILLTAQALGAYTRLGNTGCTLAKNPFLTMRMRHEINNFIGSGTPTTYYEYTDFDIGLMNSDFTTGFILRRTYNSSAPLVPKIFVMFIRSGVVVSSAEVTNGCNYGTEVTLRVSVDQSSITVQAIRCGNTVTKGWYNVYDTVSGDYAGITIDTATSGVDLYSVELMPTIITRNTTLDANRLRLLMTKLEFKHNDY